MGHLMAGSHGRVDLLQPNESSASTDAAPGVGDSAEAPLQAVCLNPQTGAVARRTRTKLLLLANASQYDCMVLDRSAQICVHQNLVEQVDGNKVLEFASREATSTG
jgi:hypothetical protein